MIICYDHFMLVQFAHVRIRPNDYSLELPALGRPEANLGNPVQRCAQDVAHAVSMQPAGSSSLGSFSCPYSPKCVERLSEKGRKSLRCSLVDHRNGTFRPIFASPHRLNPRFEGCSYPFSDSLGRGILRSSCRNNNGASERGFAVCVILCASEGP